MEKSVDLFSIIAKNMGLHENDVRTYSPLTLAFLGDAVYEVLIRTSVVCEGNTQVNKLHHRSADLVKANSQAEIIKCIMDDLNEEELAFYKRGRNAKSYTSAKNATIGDYRMATGFEALIGYLYLSGQTDRMIELVNKGIEHLKSV